MAAGVRLLGARDIREVAGRIRVRPTKKLGQNFVVEPGTVRQIAAIAAPRPGEVVLEIGPGLGSLTLALLEAIIGAEDVGVSIEATGAADTSKSTEAAGAADTGKSTKAAGGTSPRGRLIAVEIDPVLAARLPETIAERAPQAADRVTVVAADALDVAAPDSGGEPAGHGDRRTAVTLPEPPTVLAANLPYNVAVPVVLHLLAACPALERGVVMVQAEVADRMCAPPGSRVYGAPSAKLAWYATAKLAGTVPRGVFWPVPNVDSKLVEFTRRGSTVVDNMRKGGGDRGRGDGAVAGIGQAGRGETFTVIDAAFGQRRKTLRAALAGWAGTPADAERILRAAGIDPGARGESLDVTEFARIAEARNAGSIQDSWP